MAEEVGSAAGKAVGKAALKSFINPSTDILKAIPQGIIELSLRGAAAVLALLALISAAACQTSVSSSPLRNTDLVPHSQTFSAGGWIIFLSFWVILYQILAVVQLFLQVKILYTNVPFINWSLFFLVDIIAIGIAAGGYFCGGLPLAVYAGQWDNFNNNDPDVRSAPVASSASATSAFSFFSLFLFIGMIAYFFIARYILKWTTHGEKVAARSSAESDEPQDDVDDD